MRGIRHQHRHRAEPDTPEQRRSQGRKPRAQCRGLARNGGSRRRGCALPPLHATRTHDSNSHTRAAGSPSGRATPCRHAKKRMAPPAMLRVERSLINRRLPACRRLPPACGFRAIGGTRLGVLSPDGAISAFTRVHSPKTGVNALEDATRVHSPKTGVNALEDALW